MTPPPKKIDPIKVKITKEPKHPTHPDPVVPRPDPELVLDITAV
jgi:hypothetical protein